MATTISSRSNQQPPFRPLTTSFFSIDSHIYSNGVYADIRHYGWHQVVDGSFQSPGFLINFHLKPWSGNSTALRPINQRGEYSSSGDIVFLPAGATFEAHCEPAEVQDLCVVLDPGRTEQLLEQNADLRALEPCMDVRDRNIQQHLGLLAKEVAQPGFASEVVAESLAMLLMVEMFRHLNGRQTRANEPSGKMANWRLRRIVERVHDTIQKPLSIAELAAESGISSRHLVRTFKNTMGMTLTEYIADLRVQRARELLARRDMLIKEVAFYCGFRSAAAFAAAFREATGQTPREFQQRSATGSGQDK